MTQVNIGQLRDIAEVEFSDIVSEAISPDYRHDNAPHQHWSRVGTFPAHFHDGSEMNVVESRISANPPQALREFLTFVRGKLMRVE